LTFWISSLPKKEMKELGKDHDKLIDAEEVWKKLGI